jgi:uncharacterized membrane protein
VKPLAIVICVVCQLFLVIGQLLLKRAMRPREGATWQQTAVRLFPGIACMTAWFFLWLGLLEKLELSHIFPFEGLNPALMVIAAWFFFKERMTATSWIGIALITAGIALVV